MMYLKNSLCYFVKKKYDHLSIIRFPKRRDHIQQIADMILKAMSPDKQPYRIIALYSQIDASYRIIL